MPWQRRKTSRAFPPAPAENPVVMAISNNDRKHLSSLLAGGASPDAPHRETCPVVFAAHRGERDVIDLLLSHNGNINQQDAKGMTALMVAASYQQHDLARALIARGADMNIRDKDGLNALMHAVIKKDHIGIDLLVRAGAQTDQRFANGQTVAEYLSQPENTGLKATFDAAQKAGSTMDTATATAVSVRKPLQIKHKQN